jgi:hypothetical protein
LFASIFTTLLPGTSLKQLVQTSPSLHIQKISSTKLEMSLPFHQTGSFRPFIPISDVEVAFGATATISVAAIPYDSSLLILI